MSTFKNFTVTQALIHNERVAKRLVSGEQVSQFDAIADGEEDQLHAEIIKFCQREGWLYFHGSMAHKAMRNPGEPDFHIYTNLSTPPRVLMVECKTKNGKLSTEQLGVQLMAKILHQEYHVVRSMAEFESIINQNK